MEDSMHALFNAWANRVLLRLKINKLDTSIAPRSFEIALRRYCLRAGF
jgi:hypothetical protein